MSGYTGGGYAAPNDWQVTLVCPAESYVTALAIMGNEVALDFIGWLRAMVRLGVRGIECL